MKDIPGYGQTSFVAIHEALTLADYFLLTSLKKAIVEAFWADLAPVIHVLQTAHKDESVYPFFLYQRNQEQWDFYDEFFKGAELMTNCAPQHPVFRRILLEFAVRTQLRALSHDAFLDRLWENPGFAIEMLTEANNNAPRAVEDPAAVKCHQCFRLIFSSGRHIARDVRQAGAAHETWVCNKCYDKENKVFDVEQEWPKTWEEEHQKALSQRAGAENAA